MPFASRVHVAKWSNDKNRQPPRDCKRRSVSDLVRRRAPHLKKISGGGPAPNRL